MVLTPFVLLHELPCNIHGSVCIFKRFFAKEKLFSNVVL